MKRFTITSLKEYFTYHEISLDEKDKEELKQEKIKKLYALYATKENTEYYIKDYHGNTQLPYLGCVYMKNNKMYYRNLYINKEAHKDVMVNNKEELDKCIFDLIEDCKKYGVTIACCNASTVKGYRCSIAYKKMMSDYLHMEEIGKYKSEYKLNYLEFRDRIKDGVFVLTINFTDTNYFLQKEFDDVNELLVYIKDIIKTFALEIVAKNMTYLSKMTELRIGNDTDKKIAYDNDVICNVDENYKVKIKNLKEVAIDKMEKLLKELKDETSVY